jgi:hydroxyacylglutathione hydrolase
LLDVRSPREWAARHIDNSVNIPLNHLQERVAEIPRNRRIAVHCAGGYRSSIAASILHQYGITDLVEMAGGLAAWDAATLSPTHERNNGLASTTFKGDQQ